MLLAHHVVQENSRLVVIKNTPTRYFPGEGVGSGKGKRCPGEELEGGKGGVGRKEGRGRGNDFKRGKGLMHCVTGLSSCTSCYAGTVPSSGAT